MSVGYFILLIWVIIVFKILFLKGLNIIVLYLIGYIIKFWFGCMVFVFMLLIVVIVIIKLYFKEKKEI